MQLPHKYTDRLLAHLKTCHACIAAKAMNTRNYCDTGKLLMQLTLKERHGDR